MTRKDVSPRLTFPSCLLPRKPCYRIVNFLFQFEIDETYTYIQPKCHYTGCWWIFLLFSIYLARKNERTSVCLAITLAFSLSPDNGRFHKLASRRIKIFQSKESWLGDTMAARVNGISRVTMGAYKRDTRTRPKCVPTHVSYPVRMCLENVQPENRENREHHRYTFT